MIKAKQFQKNIQPRQVLLYRNVFYSRVSATVVFCLLISFILQPFERAFAAELISETVMQPETITNLAVDAALYNDASGSLAANEGVTETASNLPQDTIVDEVSTTTLNELPAELRSNEPSDTETTATTSNVIQAPIVQGPFEGSGDVTVEPSNNTPTVATTTVFTDEEIQDLITPADEIPDEVVSSALATATLNTVAVSNVYSDATMQFNKSDCVTVEDGSFYCQVAKEETVEETDGLFAIQDIDGDLEIYLRKNGELTQLTFNKVDDAAPYFDSSSNSIVWHRLIDDRYQIISYAIDSKQEVQLTAEAVNNMEPSRSGSNTVWQRWNNENWDIVLYDGTETTFITDSGMHDIAPKIKGDLVMWNRLHPDTTQTIELYDLATKEFTTISDTEGGALSNPRMVLVYETEFENGDIITKGYDVETGEITPIATKAAEIPDKLPEPDATGETRALLPVKNPLKEDVEISDDIFPDLTPSATSTPTVINPGDLVISTTTVATVVTPESATTTIDRSELTLDLTKPKISLEEATMTIAIPAFVASTTSEKAAPILQISNASSTFDENIVSSIEELAP